MTLDSHFRGNDRNLKTPPLQTGFCARWPRIGPKKTTGNRAIYRYRHGDIDAYIGVDGATSKIVWVAGAPADETIMTVAENAIFDTRDASGGTGNDKDEFYAYSPMDNLFDWKLTLDGEYNFGFVSGGVLYVYNNEGGDGLVLTAIK